MRTYSGHSWVNAHQSQEKRRKERKNEKMEEKKDQGTEGETPYINPAIDELIDEEQMGQTKREQRNRKRVSNPATLDPVVTFYDLQGFIL